MTVRSTVLLLEIHRLRAVLCENRVRTLLGRYHDRIEALLQQMDLPEEVQAAVDAQPGDDPATKVFNFLLSGDPDQAKAHSDWIVRTFLGGGLPLDDVFQLPETLSVFLKAKPRMQGQEKDINAYATLADLNAVVARYAEPSARQVEKQKRSEMMARSGIVLNNADWLIVEPNSMEESCYWGVNTTWCTANSSPQNNMWASYRRTGPFYVILHKPTNSRWGLAVGREFVNEQNQRLNLQAFLAQNPEVDEAFQRVDDKDGPGIPVEGGIFFQTSTGFIVKDRRGVLANVQLTGALPTDADYQAKIVKGREPAAGMGYYTDKVVNPVEWAEQNPEAAAVMEKRDMQRALKTTDEGVVFPYSNGFVLKTKGGFGGHTKFFATMSHKGMSAGPHNIYGVDETVRKFLKKHPDLDANFIAADKAREVLKMRGGVLYRQDGAYVLKSGPGMGAKWFATFNIREAKPVTHDAYSEKSLGFIEFHEREGKNPFLMSNLPWDKLCNLLNTDGITDGRNKQTEKVGIAFSNGTWGKITEVGERAASHNGVVAWMVRHGGAGKGAYLMEDGKDIPFAYMDMNHRTLKVEEVADGRSHKGWRSIPYFIKEFVARKELPDPEFYGKHEMAQFGVLHAGAKRGTQFIHDIPTAKVYVEVNGDKLYGYNSKFYGVGKDGEIFGQVPVAKVGQHIEDGKVQPEGIALKGTDFHFVAHDDITRFMALIAKLASTTTTTGVYLRDFNYNDRITNAGWVVAHGKLQNKVDVEALVELSDGYTVHREMGKYGSDLVVQRRGEKLFDIDVDTDETVKRISNTDHSNKVPEHLWAVVAQALNSFPVEVPKRYLLQWGLTFRDGKFEPLTKGRDDDIMAYRSGKMQVMRGFNFSSWYSERHFKGTLQTKDGHTIAYVDIELPTGDNGRDNNEIDDRHHGLQVQMTKRPPQGVTRSDVVRATAQFLQWWHDRIEPVYVEGPRFYGVGTKAKSNDED